MSRITFKALSSPSLTASLLETSSRVCDRWAAPLLRRGAVLPSGMMLFQFRAQLLDGVLQLLGIALALGARVLDLAQLRGTGRFQFVAERLGRLAQLQDLGIGGSHRFGAASLLAGLLQFEFVAQGLSRLAQLQDLGI